MEHTLKEKTIFHVDVNSAFLSWSAVSMLKKDPYCIDIRQIPSAVGGDTQTRHGIILAKSIPAKKYGIVTAEPVAQALKKCPQLVLVPSDRKAYSEYSKAFINILKKYSPLVEQVSVDEAFMDMTGSDLLYSSAEEVALKIKEEIKLTLGFTVNVGISSNKLLAKMASDFEKPDKIHTLYPEEVSSKMWPLPLNELYGIGKATAVKLANAGFTTIGSVAMCNPEKIKRLLGEKQGMNVYNSANGISLGEVKSSADEPKSYGNSVTLSRDITSDNIEQLLIPTLLKLSDSVSTRLRKDSVKAKTVCVVIKTNRFKNYSKQSTLPTATNASKEIYEMANKLLFELWDKKTPLRLIGVSASNLVKNQVHQESLFAQTNMQTLPNDNASLDKVTDMLKERYGKDALVRASFMNNKTEESAKND